MLDLSTVSTEEWFLIKSKLWWHITLVPLLQCAVQCPQFRRPCLRRQEYVVLQTTLNAWRQNILAIYKNINWFLNLLDRNVIEGEIERETVQMKPPSMLIRLLNKKFHGLSPSGGHHTLLFDQGFPSNGQLQRHLTDWNAIWQYFVSMRLYLAMLFILSIHTLLNKGQLISKGNFGVFNSSKKRTKKFCPSKLGQKLKVSGLFFGRIEDIKISFPN